MQVIVGGPEDDRIAYLADGARSWSTQRVKEDHRGRRFATIKGKRVAVEALLQEPDSHVFTVAEAETIRLYVKCIERSYGASIKDEATCERCMLGLENHLAGAHSEAGAVSPPFCPYDRCDRGTRCSIVCQLLGFSFPGMIHPFGFCGIRSKKNVQSVNGKGKRTWLHTWLHTSK